MQRWKLILIGTLAVVALGVLMWRARGPAGQAGPPVASAAPAVKPSATPPLPSVAMEPLIAPPPAAPSASAVPPLPDGAPKSVRFGVILLTYAGAEGAPKDAPSKDQALEKAKQLLDEARTSFEEAAKKGSPGSRADAGRMPRGVLEPAIEYAVFTLKKGEILAEPLDTPRGYWVVRRID